MRFSMLYSGEQILSFKSCLVFYAGDSLRKNIKTEHFSTINRSIENLHNVMIKNAYPRFLPFYYILGANLGSPLHGDVSVM